MTENDFELLTLAMAHNAQRTIATDYVAAQFAAYRISRALAEFMATCDVFLAPTLCSLPLRLGELNSMSQDLSHIGPTLRRYMPGTSMFNISGQPAMSVPLVCWEVLSTCAVPIHPPAACSKGATTRRPNCRTIHRPPGIGVSM